MADEAHEYTDGLLERLEAELNKTYSTAFAELQQKQKEFMSDYESQLKEKKQQVKNGELEKKKLDAWKKDQAIHAKWIKDMIDAMSKDMVNVDQKATSIVNGYSPAAYAENVNYGTYQIENQTSIDTSFTLYDVDTVETLIAEQPDLLPQASVDIPKDQLWNRKHITAAVTQSVLQGESISAAAKRLLKVVGMDKAAAIRTARTTITGAENRGRIYSYKRAQAMGISVKKQWLATLDMRTRMSHRRLDNEAVDVDEEFSNGLMFPGDTDGPGSEYYNCRCTLVAAVDGVDQSDAPRDSRLGHISYEEWKSAQYTQNQTNLERSKDLQKVVYDYTSGAYERINDASQKIVNGLGLYDIKGGGDASYVSDDDLNNAKLIMAAMNNGEKKAKKFTRTNLFTQTSARIPNPGDEMNWGIKSASTIDNWAEMIAKEEVEGMGGGEHILENNIVVAYHLETDKYLDISKHSAYKDQEESLVGGKFVVDKVTSREIDTGIKKSVVAFETVSPRELAKIEGVEIEYFTSKKGNEMIRVGKNAYPAKRIDEKFISIKADPETLKRTIYDVYLKRL